MVSSAPARAFAPQSGSAISARTSVTASASPRSRMPSASSGVRMRCTANTGVSRSAFLTVCGGVHAEQVRRVQRAHHAHARHAHAHVHEVDETGVLEAGGDLGGVVGGEARTVALLLVADEAETRRPRRRPPRRGPPRAPRRRSASGSRGCRRTRRCGGCSWATGTRGSGSRARRAPRCRRSRRRRRWRRSVRSTRRARGSRRARAAWAARCSWRRRTAPTPAASTTCRRSRRRCARAGGTRARRARGSGAVTCSKCGIAASSHAIALLRIWYAVVGWTCACPAMITPAPPAARSPR